MPSWRPLAGSTLILAGLGSCQAHTSPEAAAPVDAASGEPATSRTVRFDDATVDGLGFTLYDAQPADEGVAGIPLGAATDLSDADVDKLLARVAPLTPVVSDRLPFAMPEKSLPPPRTGATELTGFPSSAELAPPVVEAGPPRLLRRSPEGEVPVAPNLSVTFSEPMIALSTQEEAATHVPVQLTPAVPGNWRWLATKTLFFQPTDRFPAATEYTATIRGAKDAKGSPVADASWTFATPAVSLERVSHGSIAITTLGKGRSATSVDSGVQPRQPVIVLGFDQKVDPTAILASLKLSPDASLRLATAEEIAADLTAKAWSADKDLAGRLVAVIPTAPLPTATSFTLRVAAGAPSAEGPRRTTTEQAVRFSTYGALTLEETRCSYGSTPCPPESGWYVRFSNPLDAAAFDPASVTVTPSLPGLTLNPSGNYLYIDGDFVGRSTYTVRIPASLKDRFGQSLGADKPVQLVIGPAERSLQGPPQPFVVTDPSATPAVSFFTTNSSALKVRINEVTPETWEDWVAWNNRYRWEDAKRAPLPGRTVFSGTIDVAEKQDAQVETRVELTKYLKGKSGRFLVQVEPIEPPKDRWSRQEWIGWVETSPIGVTAYSDREDLVVWATDLATGKPLPGATVRQLGGTERGTTDAQGLTTMKLATSKAILVSQGGADVMLVNDAWAYGGGWSPNPAGDHAGWFVFDDKQLYKPGETVHLRGWVRRVGQDKHGDVGKLGGDPLITWQLDSAMGNTIASGTTRLSGLGGFNLDIPLPKTPDLGQAVVRFTMSDLSVDNPWFAHTVRIEEYRTPEFEVSASAGEGPYTLGEDAIVDVSAAYYAGGGLPNADVRWEVSASPSSFVPPGQDQWSFGPYAPWWWSWREPATSTQPSQSLQAKTDAVGGHHLGIHFDSVRPARPYTVRAEATVMDVNRQAWTAQKEILVHPSELYIGLQVDRPWADKGKPIDVRTRVVDRDGKLVNGVDYDVRFARLSWKNGAKGWAEEEVDPTTCKGSSTSTDGRCAFTPNVGGQYRVLATVKDRYGRANESELRLWVSGAEIAPDRGVSQDVVTLLPERQEYQPGETATFAVQAPFWPAEGTLSIRRDGQLETRGFHMDGSSTTLSVPITEAYYPNVQFQVDLVGQKKPEGKAVRVAYASGNIELKVPPLKRRLGVTVKPAAAELEPAGKTSIDVAIVDADGRPVADAELAVVAVDEAVLGLTGYQLPDPMAVFYGARGAGVSDTHLRALVQLADPTRTRGGVEGGEVGGMLGASGMGPGGGGYADDFEADGAVARRAAPMATTAAAPPPPPAAPMEEMKKEKSRMRDEPSPDANAQAASSPIALRSNFSAVALWAPSVRTDATGHARVALQVPDSLTRYRVMVVAVDDSRRFGSGEADVTARLPLMVRPSAPRFLNFGDRFELPVVVQNQLDQPLTVDVALRASNLAVGSRGALGKRVTVAPRDRVEVRFPAAADSAGTARFQAVAASGGWADAATGELPVWTPATTEAFATYGVIDNGAIKQPLSAPKDVWPQFGGLTITTASTNLQALTDAFLYLVRYPYDCNEQRAARILGIAGLRDILTAFDAPGVPSKETLQASVAADLEALKKRQNPDGGWAFWRKNDPSWPYLGIEVTSALVKAEQKGYTVDPGMKTRGLQYVATIESRIPSWYSQEAKWMLRAYAISVTADAGQPQAAKAKALLREAGVDRLPIEAQGYILPTLANAKATTEVQQIRSFLANRVAESAAGAHFITQIADGAHVLLASDRRADGVLLDALIQTDPKSDLVPKLVDGLLAHRKRGAWANTTENAVILLAMDRYFHVYESVTPDFVARAWLGDTYAGDHAFKGRTTERARTDVPMDWLLAHPGDVTLQKDGAGRMYYRLGLDYAPKDLQLAAADYGFTVTRSYAAVDDPEDVRRDADGTWHVKAGKRVRVRLQMVAPMRRYHVALVDPLPAGLEVINPDLATSGTLPTDTETNDKIGWWWWWRTWYEHENLRDDRVEAFSSLVYDGVYDYTYVARATTPGSFVVPPAKAEEMYTPETFGRSASDRLVVD